MPMSSQCLFRVLVNTLRPRQNGRHLPDAIFKGTSLNENVWISIEISLKFVRKGPINNIPALVQIMAWHRPGDKPLSEPMMVSLLTHICLTRPQCVKEVHEKNAQSLFTCTLVALAMPGLLVLDGSVFAIPILTLKLGCLEYCKWPT